LNILIVNQYAVSPKQPGITRSFSFARELIARGHQVSIIAAGINHFTQKEEAKDLEVIEGVTFLWVKTPAYQGNSVKRIINMVSFAQSAISRGKTLAPFDLVLGSSPHLLSGLAAQQLAAHWKVPFILEVRDLWPESLIELGNFSRRHPVVLVLERLERFLYRQAAHVISVLPAAQDHLKARGAKFVTWLPNGVQTDNGISPSKPTHTESFIALYAGAHGLANNLQTVLDAAQILQQRGRTDIEIHLIGDGPQKSALFHQSMQMGLEGVRFKKAVAKNEIHDEMLKADAFLMPLKDSPVFKHGVSPNKLFDYLLMARPIIFGVRSPNNPVQDAQAGITIAPENPLELANALEHLANLTPKERLEMGLRGRQHVIEHYNFTVLGEHLEWVLLKILENSK
jgi:glycosyltransferase involved in cell wall biosynthesis